MGNAIDVLENIFLGKLELDLPREVLQDIGETPFGFRRIAPIPRGRFIGPRLNATVLQPSADWTILRADKTMLIDVRITLQTDDDALIYMHYNGIAYVPETSRGKFNQRKVLPYEAIYVRTTPRFETSSPRYDWLNNIIAVGNGMRTATGALYHIFEIC